MSKDTCAAPVAIRLTPREAELHRYMRQYQQANFRPPCFREMAEALGVSVNRIAQLVRDMLGKHIIRDLANEPGSSARRYMAVPIPGQVKAKKVRS